MVLMGSLLDGLNGAPMPEGPKVRSADRRQVIDTHRGSERK